VLLPSPFRTFGAPPSSFLIVYSTPGRLMTLPFLGWLFFGFLVFSSLWGCSSASISFNAPFKNLVFLFCGPSLLSFLQRAFHFPGILYGFVFFPWIRSAFHNILFVLPVSSFLHEEKYVMIWPGSNLQLFPRLRSPPHESPLAWKLGMELLPGGLHDRIWLPLIDCRWNRAPQIPPSPYRGPFSLGDLFSARNFFGAVLFFFPS